MTSWACLACTYRHESEKEQQFLRCAICAAKKPASNSNNGAGCTASPRRTESTEKPSGTPCQKSHQMRQGNLLEHFGGHPRADAKRRRTSSSSSSIESKPSLKTPSRSILDALKPQKASSFAPPVRYRDSPKDKWRTIAKDDEIETLCPMTLVRDVLPSGVAAKLLDQLEEESATWNRGKWISFGKAHAIPRMTAPYNLAVNAAASNQPTERIHVNTLQNNIGDADDQAIQDDEDDEYIDDQRPITPELREAARCVAEQVQRHCPWAAMNENQGWEPTFAFANRYANGQDCVGWHSDHITPLGPRPIIVGLTLGACRRFDLRQQVDSQNGASNSGAKNDGNYKCRHVSVPLPHNSLCIMWNDAQESWQHSVPRLSDDGILKHPKVGAVRISLTFRKKRSIPDQGNCYCGRPAGLKAKDGRYYLFCRPYGKDKQKTCHLWKPCPWAEAEAKRLVALETFARGNSDSGSLDPGAVPPA